MRRRLQGFVTRWSVHDRSERAEALTFLNELFACYGQDRQAAATFEEPQAGRFLDLLWPHMAIFEMKAPSEARRLEKRRPQAFDYWRNAADPERNIATAAAMNSLTAPASKPSCGGHDWDLGAGGRCDAELRAAVAEDSAGPSRTTVIRGHLRHGAMTVRPTSRVG